MKRIRYTLPTKTLPELLKEQIMVSNKKRKTVVLSRKPAASNPFNKQPIDDRFCYPDRSVSYTDKPDDDPTPLDEADELK